MEHIDLPLAPPDHQSGPRPAPALVALSPRTRARVAAQAEGFVQGLLEAPIGSELFRRRCSAALAIGEAELEESVRIGRVLLLRCCRGVVASPAFRVKLALQAALHELGSAGSAGRAASMREDAAARLLRYEAAAVRIDAAIADLATARERLADSTSVIEDARMTLRAGLRRLRAAACFVNVLERRVRAEILRCGRAEPARAQALAAHVLAHVTRRRVVICAHEAALAHHYLVLDPLEQAGGDLAATVERLRAAAAATLVLARRLARVTGRGMRMLASCPADDASRRCRGERLEPHSKAVQSPGARIEDLDGLGRMQAALDRVHAAAQALDEHRTAIIARLVEHEALIDPLFGEAGRDRGAPGERPPAPPGDALP